LRIFSTSSFDNPLLAADGDLLLLAGAQVLFALTCRMPFASMSKVTSTCGHAARRRGMSVK